MAVLYIFQWAAPPELIVRPKKPLILIICHVMVILLTYPSKDSYKERVFFAYGCWVAPWKPCRVSSFCDYSKFEFNGPLLIGVIKY